MHHNTQKHKLTEYLRGIYYVLRDKKYITTSFYQFRKSNSKYETGLNYLCVDLLYSVVTQEKSRLVGFANRIMSEGIEGFLNKDYIEGAVKKPKKGMSALCWEMLEKLQQNDLKYFDDLFLEIQEKNIKKNIKIT